MDIETLLLNIVLKHGIKAAFGLFGSAIVYMACKVGYKYIIEKISERRKRTKLQQKDLYNHALFHKLRVYLNYEIQHLIIGEPLREALFRDFLIIKFTSIKNEFLHFLDKGSLDKMSVELYRTKISECVDNIVREYEEKARKDGIPEIVIVKFNEWHKDRINAMHDFLNDIHDTQIFATNIARTHIVFDFVVHILNMTIVDAKKTLINLNGDLDSVTYKGIVSRKKKQ